MKKVELKWILIIGLITISNVAGGTGSISKPHGKF